MRLWGFAENRVVQITTSATPFVSWAQSATVNRWRQNNGGDTTLAWRFPIGRAIGMAGNELKGLGQFASPVRSFHDQLRRLGLLPA
jgi:hypothetical protein